MPVDTKLRECPMCGEMMRPHEREIVDTIPGTSEVKRRKAIEWVCPDCDYFEEDDGENGKR
jgi:C4-type Zn-finger protein